MDCWLAVWAMYSFTSGLPSHWPQSSRCFQVSTWRCLQDGLLDVEPSKSLSPQQGWTRSVLLYRGFLLSLFSLLMLHATLERESIYLGAIMFPFSLPSPMGPPKALLIFLLSAADHSGGTANIFSLSANPLRENTSVKAQFSEGLFSLEYCHL